MRAFEIGTRCVHRGRRAHVVWIHADGNTVNLQYDDRNVMYPVRGSFRDIKVQNNRAVKLGRDELSYVHTSFEAVRIPIEELDKNMDNAEGKEMTRSEARSFQWEKMTLLQKVALPLTIFSARN